MTDAGLWHALGRDGVVTAPDAEDVRLRGRTYAVPFEDVWRAALTLLAGPLRGWRALTSDDQLGEIRAEAVRGWPRAVDDLMIRIVLDDNAQTRVDVRARSREGGPALRRNRSRIIRFLTMLDEETRRTTQRRLGARQAPATDQTA